MYYQYFGLNEAPFSIAVNPRYLFMSPRHRDALAHLLYGVGTGGGFILLTGEVGTGKTTLNRCLLEQLPDDTDIAIILNPALNALELLATVCDELDIAYDPEKHTLKTLTDALHAYLLANHRRGRKTVLLIDEAQHLDFEVMEQIRLLTNLETHSEKLLQIILIGQPELAQMLAQPELRQLNQRITARYNLGPLNLEETGAYIRHRLQVAGMDPAREVFPGSVVRVIHRHTRGIPRLINVLCDRIMLGAYGRNKTRADQAMVHLAAQEVMGASQGKRGSRGWPLAVAAVLLLGLAAGWLLVNPSRLELDPAQPTVAVDMTSALDQLAPGVAETAVPGAVTEAAPEAPLQAASNWLLSPADAMSQMWSLSSTEPEPVEPCSDAAQADLGCVEGQAQTWDELARFDRPLLLQMITPERFAAAVVLLDVSGHKAWVATTQAPVQLELAELGPLWTGRYRFFWRPPEGFERPLGLGDNSAVVKRVAALFARLDGQQQALSGARFNQALQQRVRLFQRQHALEDDGFVGMQTLLKLNEALGIDATAAQARRRLQDSSKEVVAR